MSGLHAKEPEELPAIRLQTGQKKVHDIFSFLDSGRKISSRKSVSLSLSLSIYIISIHICLCIHAYTYVFISTHTFVSEEHLLATAVANYVDPAKFCQPAR